MLPRLGLHQDDMVQYSRMNQPPHCWDHYDLLFFQQQHRLCGPKPITETNNDRTVGVSSP